MCDGSLLVVCIATWRLFSSSRSRILSFLKSFLIKLVLTCKKKKKSELAFGAPVMWPPQRQRHDVFLNSPIALQS